jgi:hypothetical protein
MNVCVLGVAHCGCLQDSVFASRRHDQATSCHMNESLLYCSLLGTCKAMRCRAGCTTSEVADAAHPRIMPSCSVERTASAIHRSVAGLSTGTAAMVQEACSRAECLIAAPTAPKHIERRNGKRKSGITLYTRRASVVLMNEMVVAMNENENESYIDGAGSKINQELKRPRGSGVKTLHAPPDQTSSSQPVSVINICCSTVVRHLFLPVRIPSGRKTASVGTTSRGQQKCTLHVSLPAPSK